MSHTVSHFLRLLLAPSLIASISSLCWAQVTAQPQTDGKVVVSGVVPDEATRQSILANVRGVYGAENMVDQLGVAHSSMPPNWSTHIGRIITPLLKQVRKGQLRITGNVVELTGEVSNENDKQLIAAQLAGGLNPTYTIRNRLSVVSNNTEQSEIDAALANKIIEFGNGSAELTHNGRAVLEGLYPILQKFAQRSFLVTGHTDAVGSRTSNIALSRARAESVKRFFVEKGLDATRFVTQGMGPDKPLAPNDTETNRARNRRIEFTVLPTTPTQQPSVSTTSAASAAASATSAAPPAI